MRDDDFDIEHSHEPEHPLSDDEVRSVPVEQLDLDELLARVAAEEDALEHEAAEHEAEERATSEVEPDAAEESRAAIPLGPSHATEAESPDELDAESPGELDTESPREPDDEQQPEPEEEAAAGDETPQDATTLETEGASAEEPEPGATPLVERERPRRRPFVSRKAIAWTAIVILAMIAVTAGVLAYLASSRVDVPDLQGTSLGAARVATARKGLEIAVGERRFSSLPRDQVLQQTPAPGERVARGTTVEVVISAGTEQFTMPDVIGDGITLARGVLESRGLAVQVQTQPSQEQSGTVLASTPAPNAPVQTGDVVRLTVASSAGEPGSLKPFQLKGRVFVIDPAPVASGDDTPMEISRRLRALLEASGATVLTTRSAVATATTEAQRASQVKSAAPTAVVGLDVSTSGPAGLTVRRLDTGPAESIAASMRLQQQIVAALATGGHRARTATAPTDVVLSATNAPAVRVILGSTNSKDDLAAFRDPKWADSVARAIYQTLGQSYGGS